MNSTAGIGNRLTCAIANGGGGSWAFDELARDLAEILWVEVTETPRDFNYLLSQDLPDQGPSFESFIPHGAIRTASDKRLIAAAFEATQVPSPATCLLRTRQDIDGVIRSNPRMTWCLKWPIGCGAAGHCLLTDTRNIPSDWPTPFVLQQFIGMAKPEVYRRYCIDGDMFGW